MPNFTPPDRILYVCAATRFGPANLVPIYALGRKRVGHLAILRGVDKPDKPNEAVQREAMMPAERIRDFAFAEMRLAADCITVLDGDPDSFMVWEAHARTIVEIARHKGWFPSST